MKTKQIWGVFAAAIAFILVCISSMYWEAKMTTLFPELENMVSAVPVEDFIGVITIEGTIVDSEVSAFSEATYDHAFILDSIKECKDSSNNKGILLKINSPGGTVNASDEVYLKLMEYKEKTKRPVWVYMKDEACSGGYYIAMAGDKLYANRNAWTGSIGVYIELLSYKGLFDKIGVNSIYFASGRNKTMGSPTKDMTEEQKSIFQALVDEPYQQFLDIVITGRKNMTKQQVKTAADGRIYTANQALKIGLIDKIGDFETTKKDMKKKVGSGVEMYEFDQEDTFFSDLMSEVKDVKKKTQAEMMIDYLKNDGSGVAMYYAMPGQ